ncbi:MULTISPECIES: hypothetical protein [unclassified Chryseobacterium]|uniref:hypothetical protein n=1 Tax=unclassified Chryseobacterium TaxID=2593645 RepID=UPI0011583B8F|nr:hypothetical protein [Chryseobacterium sp. ON_d1]
MENDFKNDTQSLINGLRQAERMLSEFSGGYSGQYFSAEEFHKDLKDHIFELENGNKAVLEDLFIWFAPTCQWDEFVGDTILGERIFQQITTLKNN